LLDLLALDNKPKLFTKLELIIPAIPNISTYIIISARYIFLPATKTIANVHSKWWCDWVADGLQHPDVVA